MATGRKPAPLALQLIKGKGEGKDSGGRPIKHPPKFKREAPAKPEGLSDFAAEMWDEVVAALEPLDVLKVVDSGALQMACEAYSMWRHARDTRLEKGQTTITATGGLTVAPWVRVESSAAKEFRAWCSEFGLTPSAEMKIAKGELDGGDDDNPFEG